MPEPEFHWALVPHLCEQCLARLIARVDEDGRRIFRCTNCGVESPELPGLTHPPICACASKIGTREAGIRCVRNERPRPELPGEIVAMEIG